MLKSGWLQFPSLAIAEEGRNSFINVGGEDAPTGIFCQALDAVQGADPISGTEGAAEGASVKVSVCPDSALAFRVADALCGVRAALFVATVRIERHGCLRPRSLDFGA